MPGALYFGAYRLPGPEGPLYRHEAEVKLPPKALTVLWLLAGRSGQVVTKAALLDELWAETAVGEDALSFQIQALRHALDDDARHPRYIATVHRIGYRFVAPVSSEPPPSPRSEAGSDSTWRPGITARPGDRPLVARDAELADLHDLFTRSLSGERQVVFVTGEAGIGKTALVEAFLARIAAGHVLRIGRGQCVQHVGAGEAYHPFLEALGGLCRGGEGERLVRLLRHHAPGALAQMPAAVPEETRDALQRSVQGITRARMLRELADALEAVAADRPLVLLLEDLHWSDTSTVELLATIARRREPARVLLLGTYRPVELIIARHPLKGAKQELVGTGHAIELPLGYLNADAVRTFVRMRLPHVRDEPVTRFVHRRTDGHPLFMVHMTEYLAEQGACLQAVTAEGGAASAAEQAVPQRLRELIEAQFERLATDEQRLLEVASIEGAEFDAASVAAAAQCPLDTVETTCQRLVERSQFVDDRGLATWPDGSVCGRYGFRHALYQQVVSRRLSTGEQARLHRAIATRKAAGYGDRAGEIAVALALHFERGGDRRRAAHFHRQAAEKALRRHAYPESLASVDVGLELLAHEPVDRDAIREQLLLQLARGAALLATRGFSAPEVEATYTRARELSQQLDDAPTLVPALYGLWNFSLTTGDLSRARALADHLLVLADRHPEPSYLLPACNAAGWTAFFTGESAIRHAPIDRSLALYDHQRDATLTAVYGEDMGVVGHMCAALTRWWLGCASDARRHVDQGLQLAHALAHPFGVAQMLWADTVVSQQCGNVERVLDATRGLIAVCEDHDFGFWLTGGRILQGWALAERGRVEDSIEQIRRGLDEWHAAGATLTRPYALALLAMAYAKAGRRREGLPLVDDAMAAARDTGERWYDAELCRLRGELLLPCRQAGHRQAGDVASHDAERCFVEALEIARSQRARSLELRAAVSLARVRLAGGRRGDASRVLAETAAWFTDAEETADLAAARALLKP